MFERYTEKARQVIFFARYEASQFDSQNIETEHLLLGLLRNDHSLTDRFNLTSAKESIREQIKSQTAMREKVPPSVDLPLSFESKRVLAYGAEEAQRLNHKHIGTGHLLLGLLREEKSFAAVILNERGVHLSEARQEIARSGLEMAPGTLIAMNEYLSAVYRPDCDYVDGKVQGRNCAEPDHGSTQTQFLLYLRNRQEPWGIKVVLEQRVQVSPTRVRVPDLCVLLGEPEGKVLHKAPFLCIEVLSPEDRVSRLLDRVDDYLDMGVAHVWVVDPKRKAAFQITPVDGWREVKDGVLRTQDPSMDIPLAEIFA